MHMADGDEMEVLRYVMFCGSWIAVRLDVVECKLVSGRILLDDCVQTINPRTARRYCLAQRRYETAV